MHRHHLALVLVTACLAVGCATSKTSNTGRTAMEQMLIANAVDHSLNKVDFSPLAGRSVFLDVGFVDCSDKNYVIAATRDRILQSGAKLMMKPEEAEIVIEARTGAVGTDQTESYVGIPEVALPGPLPVAIPQIKLWNRSSQTATAKIGLVAYDAKTRKVLGEGGSALARSDDNKTFLFGLGPYESGAVKHEYAHGLSRPLQQSVNTNIAFAPPSESAEPGRVRLASNDDGEVDKQEDKQEEETPDESHDGPPAAPPAETP